LKNRFRFRLGTTSYILHLACDRRDAEPSTDLARWHALHRDSVSRLLDLVAPERLCIENLGYAFERVAGIVTALRLAICCDIGHLLLYGVEVAAHLDRYLPRTRVIHLNLRRLGTCAGCSKVVTPGGLRQKFLL
jgi:sugar phosphate isomerase/epimerase